MPNAAAVESAVSMVLGVFATGQPTPTYIPGRSLSEVGPGCCKCKDLGETGRGLIFTGLRAGLFHGGGEGEKLIDLGNLQRNQQPFVGADDD